LRGKGLDLKGDFAMGVETSHGDVLFGVNVNRPRRSAEGRRPKTSAREKNHFLDRGIPGHSGISIGNLLQTFSIEGRKEVKKFETKDLSCKDEEESNLGSEGKGGC